MSNISNKLDRLPADYTFGVELEFSGGVSADEAQKYINLLINRGLIRSGWKVHYDSSVVDERGLGAEIVSPVLTDNEQTERELKIITDYIKSVGGVMNDKVGGHVHYGVQCLGNNIEEIKRFFKLYTVFEPLLYKISTGDLDYVRTGCGRYAKPIQKRLTKVIDSKIDSLTELFLLLESSLGANATHYGENRYYGLNIQRIVEAIREKDENISTEQFLNDMLNGKDIYDNNGNKLSPTIEMRFRNGSSDPDEIMRGIRMGGQLFVTARRKNYPKDTINSLYRHAKKRITYCFDKVLNRDRERTIYDDCADDEEILRKKFAISDYGNGKITYDEFKTFINVLYPDMNDFYIMKLALMYIYKLKQSPYKEEKNNIVRTRRIAA